MQARYYDPVIGRFYSNDPVDAWAHMQRENNPYKYIDPYGHDPVSV
jgi:RHS repeat-associated protein